MTAGTDLFQRYIITSLQTTPSGDAKNKAKGVQLDGATEDFKAVRAHLLANSRLFLQRARDSRGCIAGIAKRFVRNGSTILTCGKSRVVAGTLKAAAVAGSSFRVIYVEDASDATSPKASTHLIPDLRNKGIPVATIPFAGIASALPAVDLALVGAECVVENGGIVSSMGTHQIGILMKSVGKPLYVTAESHKFVRVYPLDEEDLGIGNDVLRFQTGEVEDDGVCVEGEWRLDLTPPELITAIVTETGVQTPNAVSEELIKMWY